MISLDMHFYLGFIDKKGRDEDGKRRKKRLDVR